MDTNELRRKGWTEVPREEWEPKGPVYDVAMLRFSVALFDCLLNRRAGSRSQLWAVRVLVGEFFKPSFVLKRRKGDLMMITANGPEGAKSIIQSELSAVVFCTHPDKWMRLDARGDLNPKTTRLSIKDRMADSIRRDRSFYDDLPLCITANSADTLLTIEEIQRETGLDPGRWERLTAWLLGAKPSELAVGTGQTPNNISREIGRSRDRLNKTIERLGLVPGVVFNKI